MKRKIALMPLLAAVWLACNPGNESAGQPADNGQKEVVNVVTHYDNGMVEKRGKNIDGKRSGKWESFYPSGYKWSEVEYRNGIKNGDVVVYHPNGMMKYQGRYYDDDRAGIWIFYDTSGVAIKRVDMDEADLNLDTLSTSLRKP